MGASIRLCEHRVRSGNATGRLIASPQSEQTPGVSDETRQSSYGRDRPRALASIIIDARRIISESPR